MSNGDATEGPGPRPPSTTAPSGRGVTLNLPGIDLLPARETERGLGMSLRQWQRLRKRIQECEPGGDLWDRTWNIALGIALTAAIPARDQYIAGVGVWWIVVFCVSAVTILLAWAAERSVGRRRSESIADVLED